MRDHRRNRSWDVLAVVSAGGVIGAEARHALTLAVRPTAAGWPWATLLTNVSGCLLLGALMVAVTELTAPHRLVRPFLGAGVLGGFTTFSGYAVEVERLLAAGHRSLALGYLTATTTAALGAAWLGVATARLMIGRLPHRRPRRSE